jgi:hypothetical protein
MSVTPTCVGALCITGLILDRGYEPNKISYYTSLTFRDSQGPDVDVHSAGSIFGVA